MIFISFLFFLTSVYAEDLKPSSSTEVNAQSSESEYEIDYEEEPGSDEAEPPAPPVKNKKTKSKGGGGPSVQGSIAKDRFVPILKSETKSIYKKNGKSLDVDTD